MTGADHLLLAEALRAVAEEARQLRATLPFDSAERQFYLGVEAAAEAVLHPEVADARPEGWLEREPPSFRNGFLALSAKVAAAVSSSSPPARIGLPTPT